MESLSIVVTGLIGSIPLPGLTFHYLQYLLGLRDLGHAVHYLESPVSVRSSARGHLAHLSESWKMTTKWPRM
jgi:hypothetical protein